MSEHDFCRAMLQQLEAADRRRVIWVFGPVIRDQYTVEFADRKEMWDGRACCKWDARYKAIEATSQEKEDI